MGVYLPSGTSSRKEEISSRVADSAPPASQGRFPGNSRCALINLNSSLMVARQLPPTAGRARVPEAMSSCIQLVDLTSQVVDKGIEIDITGHHARQLLGILERGIKIPRITAEGDKRLERVAIAGMARPVLFQHRRA